MKPPPKPSPKTAITARRKPVQSRSWQTSLAIQEAFVRLLVEKGDVAQVPIRDIVALAGVGLGTFYEYFASKDELIRVCLHLRTKSILQAMADCAQRVHGQPLQDCVGAVIDAIVDLHVPTPAHWGALYFLERTCSGLPAYQDMYQRFIAQWSVVLTGASDWPQRRDATQDAAVVMTVVYGLVSHAYLGGEVAVDVGALRQRLKRAALGYLAIDGE